MFAYNELSDLLTGELVVPIKKIGENIVCLNLNKEEVVYSFNDFDFDKTIEERSFIIEDGSSDDIDISNDSSEDNIFDNSSDTTSSDFSEDSSSDNKEDKPNEYNFDTNKDIHWLNKEEARIVASQLGYGYNSNIRKEFEIIVDKIL